MGSSDDGMMDWIMIVAKMREWGNITYTQLIFFLTSLSIIKSWRRGWVRMHSKSMQGKNSTSQNSKWSLPVAGLPKSNKYAHRQRRLIRKFHCHPSWEGGALHLNRISSCRLYPWIAFFRHANWNMDGEGRDKAASLRTLSKKHLRPIGDVKRRLSFQGKLQVALCLFLETSI